MSQMSKGELWAAIILFMAFTVLGAMFLIGELRQ